MHFVKMHGIANDYVYFDAFTDPGVESLVDRPDWRDIVARISDRHRGIGSDGVILVCRPTTRDAHVRMRMFNADASESQMCGNGVRCVAKFAHDRLDIRAKPMRVETGRGVLGIDYRTDNHAGRNLLREATVNMGEPILDAAKIPTTLVGNRDGRIIDLPLAQALQWDVPESQTRAAGLVNPTLTCVSMGNPHAVIFCTNVAGVPLDQWGPMLEHAPIFPQRINAHFVQVVSSSEVIMRTWERGSGITQACGTGACAVAVASVLTWRVDAKHAAHEPGVLVHLPGGDLRIVVSQDDRGVLGPVLMTGPAEVVFEGELNGYVAIQPRDNLSR